MHRGWTSTQFVLNLALVDFLHCTIFLPVYTLQMFYKGWFWGKNFCIFIAAFKIINVLAEALSLGMIAVSKCIGLLKPELARNLFSGLPGKLFIAMIWIYGHLFMMPIYFPKYFRVIFILIKFLGTLTQTRRLVFITLLFWIYVLISEWSNSFKEMAPDK